MADMMTFPDTWEEFEELYHITDTEQIYTNGARLVPSFRVEQWLEHMADRKTESDSEKPNNCETCRHWWESEEVCLLDDCQYEPQTMYYPQVDGITPSVIKTEPQNEFEDKPYLYWDIDGYLDEVDEP